MEPCPHNPRGGADGAQPRRVTAQPAAGMEASVNDGVQAPPEASPGATKIDWGLDPPQFPLEHVALAVNAGHAVPHPGSS